MKIGWIELWSGLSGDMLLGALLDAGWSEERLRAAIDLLGLGPNRLVVERRGHHGLTGLGIRLAPLETDPPHRGYAEIRRLLEGVPLPRDVRDRSLDAFRLLGEAEARVHGVPLERVHFHELGACDSLVDIVGSILAAHELGLRVLRAGPVPLGRGEIRIDHGTVPAPAPATAILLEGWPVFPDPVEGEFVTPTAAVLLRVLAEPGPMPAMRLERVGYGAGTREHPRLPNLVRLWIGEEGFSAGAPDSGSELRQVAVLETQIDDMNPRFVASLADELLGAGALDVFQVPVSMKKGRVGILLTVIARPEEGDSLAQRILKLSSTLGVRVRMEARWEIGREIQVLPTSFGPVRVKWATGAERRIPSVEHADVVRISKETGLPWEEIRVRILREIPPQE
jgi:uncharacterized protein (TIGR00299 family) protein